MSVKLIICGRRRSDQTLAAHRNHMRDVHGRLVLDYIAADPENAPRRYVQNHVFDATCADGDPASSILALGVDFVTEVTFPSLEAAQASQRTPFYKERLQPDEANMTDVTRVLGGPFRQTKAAGPDDVTVHSKVFALIGAPPEGNRDALCTALSEASSSLTPSWIKRCSDVALIPGPIHVVESFWFAEQATAQIFAATYFAEVIKPLRRQGLASSAMSAIALATEYVLHAGV